MPDCTKCQHRVYFEGERISVGDPGYPASAWGHYLPGEKPGWVCNVDGEDVAKDKPPEECPLCEQTKLRCPHCIQTQTHHVVWESEMEQELYCEGCGETWSDRGELLDDFAYYLEKVVSE